MKFAIYTIRDKASGINNTPFFSHNNNTAMRQFETLANDPATQIHQFPSDFTLIRIGEWDEDENKIVPEDHSTIAHAADFHYETPGKETPIDT